MIIFFYCVGDITEKGYKKKVEKLQQEGTEVCVSRTCTLWYLSLSACMSMNMYAATIFTKLSVFHAHSSQHRPSSIRWFVNCSRTA